MKFSEVVEQASALLQRKGRITYRALQREFELDDQALEDLKDELIDAAQVARDENGKVLVWVEASPVPSSKFQVQSPSQPPTPSTQSLAERRQLTVLFCDLVGSTALSAQLDPEDYRAVVQAYHTIGAASIEKYEGHLAQHLGDGLLVYFGYPAAHEDDARRAVRTGLEIITALQKQAPSPLAREALFSPSPCQGEGSTSGASAGEGSLPSPSSHTPHPNPLPTGARGFSGTLPTGARELQVRIGIHTGLVVVGEIGGGERRELLALGETPNLAARLQGLAEPNTILISTVTQRLVENEFACQPFGSHLVKGIDTPIAVYHVQSERQDASPLAGKATLTPLVGREQEVGLLYDRWEQVKEGRGQVILLSGEPGIGKSRLAYTIKEHVTSEGSLLYEARCSPYHQHSALYPLIEVLQRTLLLTRQDTDEEKVQKLEQALTLYNMQETVPLFTTLLSLPTPSQYPALTLTPQKQKERTLHALIQLLIAQAERQATVSVWEDLHWADPSSLEFLSLLIEQLPTTRLLLVLTFRPEFAPLWKPRSHISHLVLNRLGQKQVEAMIEKVAESKNLPAEIIAQIRVRTDGVPLFVEELTKSVMEARRKQVTGDGGRDGKTVGALGIPATLQEALLARLDRLSTARQIAQLGATLGREFSYELLHAVSPVSETDLQTALSKLGEAEILYQRGSGEQAHYFFKHALIQDTAYQSLLKSTRRQYHQQIAQVLESRFSDTKADQPELLAHHYTEANLIEQAIPYWQKAGERATQRSAYVEAISHLIKGLELLKTLSDTSDRAQQELLLQVTLGTALMATQGYAAPDVGKAYVRARELCEQVSDFPLRVSVLWGLTAFYGVRGDLKTARELGEPLIGLAQKVQDPVLRAAAAHGVGAISVLLGELFRAHEYLEQGIRLYDAQQHRSSITLFGEDLGVSCLCWGAFALFGLGYPEQARQRVQEALTLARALGHPTSLGYALSSAAHIYLDRREESAIQAQAEALLDLAAEQGFALRMAQGSMGRGWVLAMQGHRKEGIAQLRQGLAAFQTSGAEFFRPFYLSLLAEACRQAGQVEEGLVVIAEALAVVEKNGERFYEAELYRLKGELLLAQEGKKKN